MTAPRIAPHTVQLDQARHLFFRSDDIDLFEQVMQRQGFASWLDAVSGRSERALRAILWAGMRFRDEDLDTKRVGAMIDGARAKGISTVEMWKGVDTALQRSGFLPPTTATGVAIPTMTDGTPPVPSPGGTAP